MCNVRVSLSCATCDVTLSHLVHEDHILRQGDLSVERHGDSVKGFLAYSMNKEALRLAFFLEQKAFGLGRRLPTPLAVRHPPPPITKVGTEFERR